MYRPKVYYVAVGETPTLYYIEAGNMNQAIAKLKENGVELDENSAISYLDDVFGMLDASDMTAVKIFAVTKEDQSVWIFPVTEGADIVKVIAQTPDAIGVSLYTESAIMIK